MAFYPRQEPLSCTLRPLLLHPRLHWCLRRRHWYQARQLFLLRLLLPRHRPRSVDRRRPLVVPGLAGVWHRSLMIRPPLSCCPSPPKELDPISPATNGPTMTTTMYHSAHHFRGLRCRVMQARPPCLKTTKTQPEAAAMVEQFPRPKTTLFPTNKPRGYDVRPAACKFPALLGERGRSGRPPAFRLRLGFYPLLDLLPHHHHPSLPSRLLCCPLSKAAVPFPLLPQALRVVSSA